MLLSELGLSYGWQAVRDLLDDVITNEQAVLLVEAARTLHASDVYDQAIATAAGTSQSEKSFNALLKPFIARMRGR